MMGVVCWLSTVLTVKTLFWGYVLKRWVCFIGFINQILTGLQLTTLMCVLKYCKISLNLLITSTSPYWKPVFLFLKMITFLKEVQIMDRRIMGFSELKEVFNVTQPNCQLELWIISKMSQASKHLYALWTFPMIGNLTTLGDVKWLWWFKIYIFTLNLPLSNFQSMVLISSDEESKNKSNLTSMWKPHKCLAVAIHKAFGRDSCM